MHRAMVTESLQNPIPYPAQSGIRNCNPPSRWSENKIHTEFLRANKKITHNSSYSPSRTWFQLSGCENLIEFSKQTTVAPLKLENINPSDEQANE